MSGVVYASRPYTYGIYACMDVTWEDLLKITDHLQVRFGTDLDSSIKHGPTHMDPFDIFEWTWFSPETTAETTTRNVVLAPTLNCRDRWNKRLMQLDEAA